ncbi:MAG: energy transducer TonB [Treponema sp.]|nr:energy transducer TonB [Treponema sp.]
MNDNRIRLLLFALVAAAHVAVIALLAFNVATEPREQRETTRVMRLTDFTEIAPLPPAPPPPPERPPATEQMVEAIAETMIEVETVPDQIVVPPGTLVTHSDAQGAPSWDDFLPAHRVTDQPRFNEREIADDLVFPPIALRSGIEGRVILELFVDRNGVVQLVRILREDPEGRGFGEAAERAFMGRQGIPAMADGVPVSARFRYPVSFRIR